MLYKSENYVWCILMVYTNGVYGCFLFIGKTYSACKHSHAHQLFVVSSWECWCRTDSYGCFCCLWCTIGDTWLSNRIRPSYVGVMLGHRRRRWSSFSPTFVLRPLLGRTVTCGRLGDLNLSKYQDQFPYTMSSRLTCMSNVTATFIFKIYKIATTYIKYIHLGYYIK